MTMAMNSKAASTSASVKPARARLANGCAENVGVNFIVQPIAALGNPDRLAALIAKHHALRAGFVDESVRRETGHRRVRIGFTSCSRPGQESELGGHAGALPAQIFGQQEIHRLDGL